MSDGLGDEDPFAEEEEVVEENLITAKMVNKATFLIHKLANQKKREYTEIQKKCKKLFAYTNLAKVTLENGHQIIDKLIELTGGEEEQGARVTDDRSEHKIEEPAKDLDVPVTGDDEVTYIMRGAVRAAVDITLKEVVAKDVPVQGLGGFVLEISKVIFTAKMSEEVSG
ncbi:MAG: hypothetical protein IMF19_14260 [Proteobacteria bacterium]|nr:hypothetical protein [Pseudomonadota bacterium]